MRPLVSYHISFSQDRELYAVEGRGLIEGDLEGLPAEVLDAIGRQGE